MIRKQKEFNAQQTLNWLLALAIMVAIAFASLGLVYLLHSFLK